MLNTSSAYPREGGEQVLKGRVVASLRACGWVLALSVLAACATKASYDLKPAYQAALPAAKVSYLNCDGVSDIVCECRQGGLEAELQKPSLTDYDTGYAVLVAEIDAGASLEEAEGKAVQAVFAEVTKDIEDICTYHQEATN